MEQGLCRSDITGTFPGQGSNPESPALAGGRLTTEPAGKPQSEDVFPEPTVFHSSRVPGCWALCWAVCQCL